MPSETGERHPFVSVIVPSYNHQAFVADTIRSVLAQSYPAVDLVVIDDASPDGSGEIIGALAEEHGFTFVRNAENLGLNGTIAVAMELAKGDYISFLASDDMITPDKISRQVEYMLANQLDGVFASGFKLFEDGRTEPIDHSIIERHFAKGTILDHIYITDTDGPLTQSGLFTAKLMRDLAPLRNVYKSDDHVFLIKALEGYRIGFIPDYFFYYRIHGDNTFRKYWHTFLMRTETAALVTPERLRLRFLANIYHSQAEYMFLDGRRAMAFKFLLASFALWPSPVRIARVLMKTLRGVLKHG